MQKLKELRLQKNLTQAEMGKILNCNQSAIGKYERGELEINNQALINCAKYFNVTTDFILGLEEDIGYPVGQLTDRTESGISKDELKLLNNLRLLGPIEQEYIRGQVDALLNVQMKKEKENKTQ